MNRWNSLEITKLIVSALTPALILGVTVFFSYRRDNAAGTEQKHRRAADKRIDVWEKLAPNLDHLYCYYLYIGRWKEFGPEEIIELKRESDDVVYTNQILFDKAFIAAYERMMKEMFKQFQGWPKDAALRTWPVRPMDNEQPGAYTFTNEDNRLCIHKAYWDFQIQVAMELDIVAEIPRTPKMNQDIPGLPGATVKVPGLPTPTIPSSCVP